MMCEVNDASVTGPAQPAPFEISAPMMCTNCRDVVPEDQLPMAEGPHTLCPCGALDSFRRITGW